MPSASRSVAAALLIVAAVLLAPAAASAAHTGHIDLQDGLTLAQQFGYTPGLPPARRHLRRRQRPDHPQPRRQRGRHLVRPPARGRRLGAARPARCPARRLSGLRRHRARRRLRHRPCGLGRRRARLHRAHHPPRRRRRLPQRAHGVGRRLRDLAGRRAPVRRRTPRRPTRTTGATSRPSTQGARPLEGPPLVAVWRQLGPWKGQWAALNQLQVIKPYWSGGTLLLRTPVTVSDVALTLLQCSAARRSRSPAATRATSSTRTVVPRGTRLHADLRGHLRRGHQHRQRRARSSPSRPANDLHCTPGIVHGQRRRPARRDRRARRPIRYVALHWRRCSTASGRSRST